MTAIKKFIDQLQRHKEFKEIRKARMEKCKKCKFFREDTGTCGTPLVGDTVTYRKKEHKLCGCIMKIKTLLPSAECPVGKWGEWTNYGHEFVERVREAVNNYHSIQSKENKVAINEVYKELMMDAGVKIDVNRTNCHACMPGRVTELERFLKRHDKC